MAIDYSKLKSTLANSKIQKDNNALYQSILGLINSTQEFQGTTETDFSGVNSSLGELNRKSIFIVEDDTDAPVSYELFEYVTAERGFVIFKDIGGNASSNNITLTGDVEGVTDPVINTDFGIFRVYLGSDGLFHTW